MNVYSGRGGSSGSSSNGTRSQRRTAAPRCKCGRPSVVYTSKTLRNPNRALFGCPNFKEKLPYCNFFKWVDNCSNDSMDLEDWRMNKLELNNAEVEFKLNYMDMKLNEHEMKIREQQTKMIQLSMKMVAEFDRVEKEIRLLGRCARVFAVTIVVVGAICIYAGGRLE
ncbi:hypothetical protein QN277_012854 [Acacia crassicarpa]|uniref:GRF-type domain-containing protein n=1 Tax=Acacia crassicarpa TaxID=499986 RepID=A0AAE1N212_9FABA|nr:hypothetical protein QN277_012854 [Acacia crassicarpa]